MTALEKEINKIIKELKPVADQLEMLNNIHKETNGKEALWAESEMSECINSFKDIASRLKEKLSAQYKYEIDNKLPINFSYRRIYKELTRG